MRSQGGACLAEAEMVADGMMLPNGIAFDEDGNLYVVSGAIGIGGPSGMVLRFDGVVTPSA